MCLIHVLQDSSTWGKECNKKQTLQLFLLKVELLIDSSGFTSKMKINNMHASQVSCLGQILGRFVHHLG